MTVTYTAEVATCGRLGRFLRLLCRWRGSIYKLIWLDLLCFLFLYYILNVVYRFALDSEQKLIFESVVKYCARYSNLIPLSFVLGFYVSVIMTRWWNQYSSIPWPDALAVYVSAYVHGQDERGRTMRRTIMRYVCLSLTMTLTNISPKVKKRFPTLRHLVEAGLLVESEYDAMDSLNKKFPRHSKHWMPIVWAASVVTKARKEGRVRHDFAEKTIIDALNNFRGKLGELISYDMISIPLVYTQVVTLAVYSFFITEMMGQQWVENKKVEEGILNMFDLYFPIFTMLQFFFYMGWLKVAESLANPFGEDDDDFEVNWIIDRNLQVSYMIVDEMHHIHPDLVRDQYWDEIPIELPYTEESEAFREQPPKPSTANISDKADKGRTKLDIGAATRHAQLILNNKTAEGIDIEANSDTMIDSRRSLLLDGSKTDSPTKLPRPAVVRGSTLKSRFKRMFSKDESGTEMKIIDDSHANHIDETKNKKPPIDANNIITTEKYNTKADEDNENVQLRRLQNKKVVTRDSDKTSSNTSVGKEITNDDSNRKPNDNQTDVQINPSEQFNSIEINDNTDEFERLRSMRESGRRKRLTDIKTSVNNQTEDVENDMENNK